MTTVVDSIPINGLRMAHLYQLEAYIMWAEENQVYYGNKEQFWKRHNELGKWLNKFILDMEFSEARIAK